MPRPHALLVSAALWLASALSAQTPDSSLLTLDRVFASDEFAPEFLGQVRWLAGEAAYTKLEPDSAAAGARALVRYDAATGPARRLGARRAPGPAGRHGCRSRSRTTRVSPDGRRLLIFTNSRKVWRQNTRGDFWALDLATWQLRKLGGAGAAPSTLMFAKFSPDGGRVAYVREHNLYVEDLADGRITQLTHDGSRTIINGTFDWVYEEELNLRDGFRWSPDGRRIAYWQLDASGVRDFLLINDTDSLYSFTIPVQYPKAGTTNSAARVGRGERRRADPRSGSSVPGDPRNNYIARLEWAASSSEVVLEHLNRAQNTLEVMLGDARHRAGPHRAHRARQRLGRRGGRPALDRRRQELHLDQRARRLAPPLRRLARRREDAAGDAGQLRSSQSGERVRRAVRGRRGFGRRAASTTPRRPTTPTQLYLYRTRLDGKGKPERVTPKDQPGYHLYQISQDGRWAFHTYSAFGTPPTVDLVSLPKHKVVRTLVRQPAARATPSRGCGGGRPSFVKVDAGAGPPARRLGDEAAGVRLHQALSGALPRLRRARRPDGARLVGRRASTSGT